MNRNTRSNISSKEGRWNFIKYLSLAIIFIFGLMAISKTRIEKPEIMSIKIVAANVWQQGDEESDAQVAERLYRELNDRGLEPLIDDRDERAGVKFKDADLIGIPVQIVIGERNLKEGLIEIKDRKSKEAVKVKVEEVVERLFSHELREER